jgi:HAMP domain-containing protein
VLCSLLLAVPTSRRIAHRLVTIAAAAKHMASGDLTHATLVDTPKDEIGALTHAFNAMVRELNRLSNEHERLVLTERERLERLVSERTQTLEQSREMFRLIAESTKAILLRWISLAVTFRTSVPKPSWIRACRMTSRMNSARWRW